MAALLERHGCVKYFKDGVLEQFLESVVDLMVVGEFGFVDHYGLYAVCHYGLHLIDNRAYGSVVVLKHIVYVAVEQ